MVPVETERLDRWKEVFTRIQHEHEKIGEKLIWIIVDGFLLYWHRVCISPHKVASKLVPVLSNLYYRTL